MEGAEMERGSLAALPDEVVLIVLQCCAPTSSSSSSNSPPDLIPIERPQPKANKTIGVLRLVCRWFKHLVDFCILPNSQISIVHKYFLTPDSIESLRSLPVRDVRFSYSGFDPMAKKSLSRLDNLTALDIEYQTVGNKGASAIGKLTNLTKLSLHNTSIGVNGVLKLENLTNLTTLGLTGNLVRVPGAAMLATLTNLKHLRLASTRLSSDGARELTALTNLTSLDVANNEIDDEGASALLSLPKLASLNLAINRSIRMRMSTALSPLTELRIALNRQLGEDGDGGAAIVRLFPNLTSLDIGHCNMEQIDWLKPLTRLMRLDLSTNRLAADSAETLSAFTKLTLLNLNCNRIRLGVSGLTSLVNLQYLNLVYNGITGTDLGALSKCTNLNTLEVSGNEVSGDSMHLLSVSMTKLRKLCINGKELDSRVIEAIGRMRSLTYLTMSDAEVGDEHLPALIDLNDLTHLDVSGGRITMQGLGSLTRMTNLTSLDLQDSPIGENEEDAMASLSFVKNLTLGEKDRRM